MLYCLSWHDMRCGCFINCGWCYIIPLVYYLYLKAVRSMGKLHGFKCFKLYVSMKKSCLLAYAFIKSYLMHDVWIVCISHVVMDASKPRYVAKLETCLCISLWMNIYMLLSWVEKMWICAMCTTRVLIPRDKSLFMCLLWTLSVKLSESFFVYSRR